MYIDQARGQDGWILAKFSFVFLRPELKMRSTKTWKETVASIPDSHLDRTSLINGRFIIRYSMYMSLCVFTFMFACLCCRKYSWKSSTFLFPLFSFSLTLMIFSFSRSIPTQKSQKIFLLSQKIFAKEKFSAPTWTSTKFYRRNKMGHPEDAMSLHLACSGNQITVCDLVHLAQSLMS